MSEQKNLDKYYRQFILYNELVDNFVLLTVMDDYVASKEWDIGVAYDFQLKHGVDYDLTTLDWYFIGEL